MSRGLKLCEGSFYPGWLFTQQRRSEQALIEDQLCRSQWPPLPSGIFSSLRAGVPLADEPVFRAGLSDRDVAE